MEENSSKLILEMLPDEVILKILRYRNISSRSVVNFGETCQRFHSLVQDSLLWKRRLQNSWPKIYNVIVQYGTEEWLEQYRYVHTLERRIESELRELSPAHFWKEKEFSFKDAKPFFDMCMEQRTSLFCVHNMLSGIYSKCGGVIISDYPSKSMNTLTIQYYSGRVLRFIMHTFLMICWQEMKLNQVEMSPEKILNFYVNWIDNFEYHDQAVQTKTLDELAEDVWKQLPSSHALHGVPAASRIVWSREPLHENMWGARDNLSVHAAVRRVLYSERCLTLAAVTSHDTLYLPSVLKTKKGCIVAIGVLYEAVARRCGVKCTVVAFPNHFFVEWRESDAEPSPVYRIDLATGQLVKKRSCPFQVGPQSTINSCYHPQTLLLSLTEAMQKSAQDERNGTMHLKIESLMEFLRIMDRDIGYRQYLDFLELEPFSRNLFHRPSPNFYSMGVSHREIMLLLSVQCPEDGPEYSRQKKAVLRDHPTISVCFAVGMVCLHRMYGYTCVVTGWDVQCTAPPEWQERMGVQQLSFKHKQPFYNVLASDGTARYVAQENLSMRVYERLTVVEDILGKEFSHFTGNYYIPNAEKLLEYPDDLKAIAAYRRQPALLMPTLVNYNIKPGNRHLYNLC